MALATENEARAALATTPSHAHTAPRHEPISPESLPAAVLEDLSPPADEPSPAPAAFTIATLTAVGAPEALPAPTAATQLVDADDTLEQTVRTLTDTATIFASNALPQERALAADVLALLLPTLSDAAAEQVARRVAGLEAPPPELLSLLLAHPSSPAAQLVVERSMSVSDPDLIRAIEHGGESIHLAIAQRRHVSGRVCERLAETRNGPVLLALARNAAAKPTPAAFEIMCAVAANYTALQVPLANRADLTPAFAFELFWHAPPELRRYILTRFLVDTESVGKLLRSLDAAGLLPRTVAESTEVDRFVELLAAGQLPFATQALSGLLGIARRTAERIVTDREGEPLAAALRALGMNRSNAGKTIAMLVKAETTPIRVDRDLEDLYYVFDSLSLNKARILLSYWNWRDRRISMAGRL